MGLSKIQFEEKFFEGECREGFFVESMMKRTWAAQMEVLMVIDEICRKHNIEYFADWGTLLGAVRHQGYIPWDDDMDITMKRSDFNRFLAVAGAELPEGYLTLNVQKERTYTQLFTRVVNRNYISFKEEDLSVFHGCPYIVGVDIFPLDCIPENADEEEMQCELLKAVILLAENYDPTEENISKKIAQIEELSGVSFDRTQDLKNQLFLLANRICQLYNADKTDRLTLMPYFISHRDFILKKEWYEERIWLPFENIQVPAPKCYDEALTVMFGDWHVKVRNTQDHEYPYYKGQQKLVEKRLAEQSGEDKIEGTSLLW